MNNEKDVKPSERIEQLMDEQFKNFPANSREEYLCVRLQAVVDYLDEQAEQRYKVNKAIDKAREELRKSEFYPNHSDSDCASKAEQHAKKSAKPCPHVEVGYLEPCPDCDNSKPSPSSEPSECVKHHYIKPGNGEAYCLGCGKRPNKEPLVDGKEPLETHIVIFKQGNPETRTGSISMTMRALFDLYAEDMGYSKLPPQDRLVGLDYEELTNFLHRYSAERNKSPELLSSAICCFSGSVKELGEAIYKKFGQPKAKVLSIEDINNILERHNKYNPIVGVGNHIPASKYNFDYMEVAQAIHQALVKERL